MYPPSGGWSSITAEFLFPLGKTNEVIDVLRRLPYILPPYDDADVISETGCINYFHPSVQIGLINCDLGVCKTINLKPIPEVCAYIALRPFYAYSLVLNVPQGTVVWYTNDGGGYNSRNCNNRPPWRHGCDKCDMRGMLDRDSPRRGPEP